MFSQGSENTYGGNGSHSTAPKPPPRLKPNTTKRLQDIRRLMIKDKLDY